MRQDYGSVRGRGGAWYPIRSCSVGSRRGLFDPHIITLKGGCRSVQINRYRTSSCLVVLLLPSLRPERTGTSLGKLINERQRRSTLFILDQKRNTHIGEKNTHIPTPPSRASRKHCWPPSSVGITRSIFLGRVGELPSQAETWGAMRTVGTEVGGGDRRGRAMIVVRVQRWKNYESNEEQRRQQNR